MATKKKSSPKKSSKAVCRKKPLPSLQDQINALKDDLRIKFAFLNNRDNVHERNYRETNKRFTEHMELGCHVIRKESHMQLSEDA